MPDGSNLLTLEAFGGALPELVKIHDSPFSANMIYISAQEDEKTLKWRPHDVCKCS